MNGPIPRTTQQRRDELLVAALGRTHQGTLEHRRKCGNSPELIARVDAEVAEAGCWLEIADIARKQAWRAQAMFAAPWAAEDVKRKLGELMAEALDLQDARIAAVSVHVISEARRQ